MHKLPFGIRELEELQHRDRVLLLKQGRKDLEDALKEPIKKDVVIVTSQAYGFLLNEGAQEEFSDRKTEEGYLHRCIKGGITYECVTKTKVFRASD